MNDATMAHIVLFTLIGGLFSLIGGAILLKSVKNLEWFIRHSIPFAAGALLATVFLDLLPEGLHESESTTVLTWTLVGIIVFFIFERVTHWFHHHHDEDASLRQKSSLMIIISDTLHNALDGVVIASAFLISVPTGIITTIAVAAHEIPQEIGDFGVLLGKGMSRMKVLLVNILSSLGTVVFGVVTFALGDSEKLPMGIILGLSAGFLLYVALSDLIPTIHSKRSKKGSVDTNILLLLLGVVVVGLAVNISHGYIETEHGHGGCDKPSEMYEAESSC